jgi:hypothetical protein
METTTTTESNTTTVASRKRKAIADSIYRTVSMRFDPVSAVMQPTETCGFYILSRIFCCGFQENSYRKLMMVSKAWHRVGVAKIGFLKYILGILEHDGLIFKPANIGYMKSIVESYIGNTFANPKKDWHLDGVRNAVIEQYCDTFTPNRNNINIWKFLLSICKVKCSDDKMQILVSNAMCTADVKMMENIIKNSGGKFNHNMLSISIISISQRGCVEGLKNAFSVPLVKNRFELMHLALRHGFKHHGVIEYVWTTMFCGLRTEAINKCIQHNARDAVELESSFRLLFDKIDHDMCITGILEIIKTVENSDKLYEMLMHSKVAHEHCYKTYADLHVDFLVHFRRFAFINHPNTTDTEIASIMSNVVCCFELKATTKIRNKFTLLDNLSSIMECVGVKRAIGTEDVSIKKRMQYVTEKVNVIKTFVSLYR